MGLDRYEGRHSDHVKVGTYFRAKGLEFKAVFLPGLNRDVYPRPRHAEQSDAEYEEYRSLALGQLFVAMTRARDHLFVPSVGPPSGVISAARHEFLE
ncbi:MAG: 3'-5' exonuclease [Acidimicrobiales bacterium]